MRRELIAARHELLMAYEDILRDETETGEESAPGAILRHINAALDVIGKAPLPLFDALRAAAALDDEDAAAALIQLVLGVTDGGFASHYFCGADYAAKDQAARLSFLAEYARGEICGEFRA